MKCVILQPSYIPWRGYFHQIKKADVFVFYDDVQYDKGGWRNRNRIKTKDGLKWLTIPVHRNGATTKGIPINEIHVDNKQRWRKSHYETIRQSYSRAPFFPHYEDLLNEIYNSQPERLSEFVIDSTIAIAERLGINDTQFLRSSELPTHGHKTDRVLSVLKHLGATHYISGPSAKSYLELEKFGDVTVEFMEYDYPEYLQLYGDFEPQVSVIDLMMMMGPEAGKFIWAEEAQPCAQ